VSKIGSYGIPSMLLICQGAFKFTMFPLLRFGLHIYAVRVSDL
jgi:hypothetical protein